MSAFNHEMLMTCLPAAFEGAFAHMLFFLQRRGPDPNLDSLYRLLRLPCNSQPAADMFAKVSHASCICTPNHLLSLAAQSALCLLRFFCTHNSHHEP